MTQIAPPTAPPDNTDLLVLEPRPGWRPIEPREIWRYRELLWFLAVRDIKVRYKQTVLGASWAVIQPLFKTIVFTVIFGAIAKMPSDNFPYPVFAFCGLLPWQLFAFGLTQSGNSIIENERLITKVYFPRLIVPFASILAGLLDFAIGFVILIGLMFWYGLHPSWMMLTLPFFVLLAIVTALGVGLWIAALAALYRDFRYTLMFITELWFFATPVVYASSGVQRPLFKLIIGLNPMAGVVEGFRWAVLPGAPAPGPLLWVSMIMALLMLVSGVLYFRRMERFFADRVQLPMADPAIRIINLGKQYRLGQSASYNRFTDLVSGLAMAPFRAMRRSMSGQSAPSGPGDFWALKDVNFEVQKGEVVGLIGRNGAGKSTLLKILSRITEPTEGRVELRGRIGSLLEVGTGFHPELTGRENIYLNGAVLGMRRAEITRKFDEIVAFAETEKFLDTPVKHYSSGMYMRLAFAVAAHLEPETLLVDEVLAVGDIQFQKKCLGKMGEVARHGRTVVLVSHNMAAISSLCSRGVVLQAGRVVFSGDAQEAVRRYASEAEAVDRTQWSGDAGDEHITIQRTWVRPAKTDQEFETTSDIEIGIEGEVKKEMLGLVLGFMLWSQYDYELAYVLMDDGETTMPEAIKPGKFTRRFVIPGNSLSEGTYRVQFDVGIHMRKKIIDREAGVSFHLDNIRGRGRRYPTPSLRGRTSLFRPPWSVGGNGNNA